MIYRCTEVATVQRYWDNWDTTIHEPLASRLVASWRMSMSTNWCGSCTYLTTEPRMKQFRTELMCGYRSSSTTFVFINLMFRYWSTETRTPEIAMSFLSSTVTCVWSERWTIILTWENVRAHVAYQTEWGYLTRRIHVCLTSFPTSVLKYE